MRARVVSERAHGQGSPGTVASPSHLPGRQRSEETPGEPRPRPRIVPRWPAWLSCSSLQHRSQRAGSYPVGVAGPWPTLVSDLAHGLPDLVSRQHPQAIGAGVQVPTLGEPTRAESHLGPVKGVVHPRGGQTCPLTSKARARLLGIGGDHATSSVAMQSFAPTSGGGVSIYAGIIEAGARHPRSHMRAAASPTQGVMPSDFSRGHPRCHSAIEAHTRSSVSAREMPCARR